MALFNPTTTLAPLSQDAPPFRVFVASVKANSDPTKDPSWGDFNEEPRLGVVKLFKGSTAAGMSHAILKLSPGAPLENASLRVENYNVLGQGDRVIVGIGRGNNIRMLWAGYQTAARLNINPKREGIIFRLSGPEWIYGTVPGSGARKVVTGQIRRTAAEDDKWYSNVFSITTTFDGLANFTDERCVFNPRGHSNMTTVDVLLSADGNTKGRCWEIPDRRLRSIPGSDFTDAWTKLDALKALFTWYNDSNATGINAPDWDAVDSVLQSAGVDAAFRDVDVDGLGLWEAMRKVIGPEFGFCLDPTPPAGNSPQWSGFTPRFFARGQGGSTTLILNPLGTAAKDAAASIVRIEASKDISKVVNRVSVFGKYIRHIKLQYNGDQTPSLSSDLMKIAFQHGWSKAEGDIGQYAASSVIERFTVDGKSSTLQDAWAQKYTHGGAQFEDNKHVFRLFTWNEAGEFYSGGSSDKPAYGTTPTSFDWYRPDLTGIADGTDANAGKYCRRRRPLLDTAYQDGDIDGWRRVPPLLFISAIDATGTTQGPWVQVKAGHYRFDHERAALWITVEDLLNWRPLLEITYAGDTALPDDRNFATLLYTGKLRMLVEASIETDWAMTQTVDRTAQSGSPFVREAVYRQPRDYVQSVAYVDGITSPTMLTVDLADDSADAMNVAQQMQSAGQDQQVHSSITVSAAAPVGDAIGTILSIQGRPIDLTGGSGTRGPQVVGLEMDAEGLTWELLTESEIMKRRKLRRHRVASRQRSLAASRAVVNQPLSGDGPQFAREDIA